MVSCAGHVDDIAICAYLPYWLTVGFGPLSRGWWGAGYSSPEDQWAAYYHRRSNSSGDVGFGLPTFLAGADSGPDGAGASGGPPKVGQGASRIFATSQPLRSVLGRCAEPEVFGLLAGVVVARVAHGRIVDAPAKARDDAVRELVSVQVPWNRPAPSPARTRSGPEAGVARTGDPRRPEPAPQVGRSAMDLGPIASPNRLVIQPGRPLNRRDTHRGWLADESELFVNGSGLGTHRREREQPEPVPVLSRHRPDRRWPIQLPEQARWTPQGRRLMPWHEARGSDGRADDRHGLAATR